MLYMQLILIYVREGDNMVERWKDIEDFEGLYQISNMGNIKNTVTNKIRRQGTMRNEYKHICLCVGGVRKSLMVHRLVAVAFISNPKNLPQVNHLDEDKKNNVVTNLEWCSAKDNANYGTKIARQAKTREDNGNTVKKRVLQMKGGKIIKIWDSIYGTKKGGFNHRGVSNCCSGRVNSYAGYEWKRQEDVNE